MKKLKQFLFIFVPLLLVIAIQFLATYFAMGLSLLIESGWYSVTGSAGFLDIVDDAFSLWSSQRFNTGVLLIYNAMSIAVFGLWYYCRYGGNYRPVLRQTFHPAAIAGIVMLMPGTQYLTTYIMSFVASLFPHWMDAYESLLETAGLDDQISILMVICSVIFAPFCEELVFRGVTMHQAKKCPAFLGSQSAAGAAFWHLPHEHDPGHLRILSGTCFRLCLQPWWQHLLLDPFAHAV